MNRVDDVVDRMTLQLDLLVRQAALVEEDDLRAVLLVPNDVSCSSVSVSISTPMVASFRRAISLSISSGTGWTLRSSSAAFWIAYSAESAWFAKDMSMTRAGWPSAADRFTRRPSAIR